MTEDACRRRSSNLRTHLLLLTRCALDSGMHRAKGLWEDVPSGIVKMAATLSPSPVETQHHPIKPRVSRKSPSRKPASHNATNGHLKKGSVSAVHEILQPGSKGTLQFTPKRTQPGAVSMEWCSCPVTQMARKNQQGFHQGKQQCRYHDQGNALMILPVLPGTITRGKKAATVVRTAKMTGFPTSCVPRMAESNEKPSRC